MLITKIIAKNFKTYRELDLDLTVNEEPPIILIGGENGGGKTTLFQAIYSALYGLKVKDEQHFNKLQNAGERAKNAGNSSNKIELEIHFTGKVLHSDYKYIIKRLYTLNAQNNPVEAVMLNLNGDIFNYGTATPHAERVKKEANVNFDYIIGTMIELPRAAITADEVATHADFFSFGTNDLTQTTLGLSRDDSGRFLGSYVSQGILPKDPFMSIDQVGVGSLVKMGTDLGRKVKSNLKVGVCGEHGGDPDSIEFFHRVGLDYVSCSPFRVPIARLAAARAAIGNKSK